MAILERQIKLIGPGAVQKHRDLVKRFAEVEARLGYPESRWLRLVSGSSPMGTLVQEREWPSLAAWEAAFYKSMEDPDWHALADEFEDLDVSIHVEILMDEPS